VYKAIRPTECKNEALFWRNKVSRGGRSYVANVIYRSAKLRTKDAATYS